MRIDELEYACIFFDVHKFDKGRGCYEIETFTKRLGTVSFFPKKNKIHIHRNSKWISQGRNWLKQICESMERGTFKDLQRSEKSNLTDESIMKFGKYKGNKLEDVPNHWLIWIEGKMKDDENLDSFRRNLLLYINENKDVIDR